MLSSVDFNNVVSSNHATTHSDQTVVYNNKTTIQGDHNVINQNRTTIQGDVVNQTTIINQFFQDPCMSDTDLFCTLPNSQSSSAFEQKYDAGKLLSKMIKLPDTFHIINANNI